MRVALVGDHPDGLAFVQALVATGRHQFVCYIGSPPASLPGEPRIQADLEEALADPSIDALVVAGKPADRVGQLRRALQSERPVFCVHPLDDSPDAAYEASMIQADTGCRLVPLLPDAAHPAVQRLQTLLRDPAALGTIQWVDIERSDTGTALSEVDPTTGKVWVPGWDILRVLGGEIVEVAGYAEQEELTTTAPVFLAGRFEQGGIFHIRCLPAALQSRLVLRLRASRGEAKVRFLDSQTGAAELTWQANERYTEQWEHWDRWGALVAAFEQDTAPPWLTAVRSLELDDAARRSVERRRSSTLDFQEVSEQVGFKGTMTLVGCGLLWVIIFLAIASRWVPWIGWLIVPVLAGFLGLQFLQWIIPPAKEEPRPPTQ